MANTPNYGWETPDDTDYVYQGAAAARTTANAIDSTVNTLQTSLNAVNAAKVAKAGDTMTGQLVVPTDTSAGRAIGLLAAGTNENIIQFLNTAGNTQLGSIVSDGSTSIALNMANNSSYLLINSQGDNTRGTSGVARPMAFATQCGTATVAANSSTLVTLATTRFTQAPIIMATPNSVTSSVISYHVGNSSTTNFRIYNTSGSSRDFYWQAIQMTSSSAAG